MAQTIAELVIQKTAEKNMNGAQLTVYKGLRLLMQAVAAGEYGSKNEIFQRNDFLDDLHGEVVDKSRY